MRLIEHVRVRHAKRLKDASLHHISERQPLDPRDDLA